MFTTILYYFIRFHIISNVRDLCTIQKLGKYVRGLKIVVVSCSSQTYSGNSTESFARSRVATPKLFENGSATLTACCAERFFRKL